MKRHGFSSLQAWVLSDADGEYAVGAEERQAALTRLHKRYEKDRSQCPKCGDKRIEGGHCKKCGYVWVGIYQPEIPEPVAPPLTEVETKYRGDFGTETCYCGQEFVKNAVNQEWCPACQIALSRSQRQTRAQHHKGVKRVGVTAGAMKPRIRGRQRTEFENQIAPKEDF